MNNWSNNLRYSSSNSQLIPQSGGVYEVLRNDNRPGLLTNVYVGKADDLNARYLQHLSDTETNQCLRENIRNNECYFRYALVATESDRVNIEGNLLQTFTWECNTQQR